MDHLNSALELVTERFRQAVPNEVSTLVEQSIANLASSDLVAGALKVGEVVPDFELPDASGATVRSRDLLQKGPLIITFYRGSWCPYCSLALRALNQRLAEVRARGAMLIAVSPQKPDGSLTEVQIADLAFPVLSDIDNHVARRFGLVFKLDERLRSVYAQFGVDLEMANGNSSFELPVPATYVVGADGRVCGAHVEVDYRKRLSPDVVLDWLDECIELAS